MPSIGAESRTQDSRNGQIQDDQLQNSGESQTTRWHGVWQRNKGVVYVFFAQLISSPMDAIVRFLQQGGTSFHPFQIIVFRMGTTCVLSSLVLCYRRTPDFPLGSKGVRGWLLLRALFGSFGLYCLYYSIHYLPLAEATVIRFLVPLVTAVSCALVLGQHLSTTQLFAGIIALLGVVIIAHPISLFGDSLPPTITRSILASPVDPVSPAQRLFAILLSLLGVVGASGAYTIIRIIGSRAHPLTSVNYFAFISTFSSSILLTFLPDIHWISPSSFTVRDWILIVCLGLSGFALQCFLTTGLTVDKSARATSMLYTQVLFALIFDYAIWNVAPDLWSIVGGAIVIASTLWSALQETSGVSANRRESGETGRKTVDEESALLAPQREVEHDGTTQ